MITATSMLDWAEQWRTIAGDGFKAEMIWLADYYGLAAHPTVQGYTFADPEWEFFAFKMMPSVYKNPNRRKQHNRHYEILQEEAIYNMDRASGFNEFPLEPGDDHFMVVHKTVWASQFGRREPVKPDAIPILEAGLADVDDDIHAKSAVSLKILEQIFDTTRIDVILSATDITPQTYHAQFCALITKGIR